MVFKKILVANRSEIAIRVFRAAEEMGIKTAAIYSKEDRFALHRFKTDESYLIGENKGPIQAYLDIDSIIRVAKDTNVDAIHPGYGFLSESPEFAQACSDNDIAFIGPSIDTLKKLGNKTEAKKIANEAQVKTIPSVSIESLDEQRIKSDSSKLGFPLMIKANWGGGGRGMRVVSAEKDLLDQIHLAKSEAQKSFGKGDIFLEKYVEDASHIEVQILGDKHGNIVHLFERDCSLQRRHQKILERAPAHFLDGQTRKEMCDAAVKIAKHVNYVGAGTVEFLLDRRTNEFFFIEVNPRIQVEHTVTEEVTGIDLIKAQIKVAEGGAIGSDVALPSQSEIKVSGHAIQCRITTEDPTNDFMPDYGKIITYRSASGFGVRLDAGTAASGAVVTPYYDSLLVKVTSRSRDIDECRRRMDRALREFRVRGVKTNIVFLKTVINHPSFVNFNYNTQFIDIEKSLYSYKQGRDRASKIVAFLGNVIVNNNKEIINRSIPKQLVIPAIPPSNSSVKNEDYVSLLKKKGPEQFAQWIKSQEQLFITDTTMRDAHQSLLATRMRSNDILNIADYYSMNLSQLFSIECWGGATFDVAMRFLKEDPWKRLADLKSKAPNILTQMLLRGSNAVGYKNYPDNVVRFFIQEAAQAGMDVFRVFDSLNWIENMQVAIEEVCKQGKICEGAICYTNDVTNPSEQKYTLKYYLERAQQLERMGVHIIAIKDMAGLCKPEAAKILVRELKETTNLPIHFHTHDTSGTSAASVLSAINAGVDIVDAAMDSMSGQTSQPALGSITSTIKTTSRKSSLDEESIRSASLYWEEVRQNYLAFESNFRGGSSDVYVHQMPGGQFTNLKEQAHSLGIETHKWDNVVKTYSEVNKMFGDIIKVTPTSKVVGDMALFMVSSDLSVDDVLDSNKEMAFPESVVDYFSGNLGQPFGGFPKELQKKVLKDIKPISVRPGSVLSEVNLEEEKKELKNKIERNVSNQDLASYLMYPKVFLDFCKYENQFGDFSFLSTPLFFYGPEADQEFNLDIEKGKSLIVRYLTKGNTKKDGKCSVFFEINGQPRTIEIKDDQAASLEEKRKKASKSNEIGSPLNGQVSEIKVNTNDKVNKGDKLIVIEAMKMETVIHAEHSGVVSHIEVEVGDNVDTKDLLLVIE